MNLNIQFIEFIRETPADTKLNHRDAFDGCAVGLFAKKISKQPNNVFEQLRDELDKLTTIEMTTDVTANVASYHDFLDDINNANVMDDNSIDTMGCLVKWIDKNHPNIG